MPDAYAYAGLGIYDTMQFIGSDVATICTGMAASMGAVLPPATDADLYKADTQVTNALTPLPANMEEAIALTQDSAFIKGVLGEDVLTKYLHHKRQEAADFAAVSNKVEFYRKRYFRAI